MTSEALLPESQEHSPAAADSAMASRKRQSSSLLHVLWRCWLRPGENALQTDHVSLWRAWGFHFLIGSLAFFAFLALIALFDRQMTLAEIFRKIIEEIVRFPTEALLITGGTILLIEGGWLLTALLFMPWGANRERFRVSFKHSLRVCWLHTSHVWLYFILLIPLSTGFQQLNRHWYNARMMSSAYSLSWSDRPWYINYDDEFIGTFSILFAIWFLAALLRGIGTRRGGKPDLPPQCEFCGYNLTHMAMEARCPECGEPVAESLRTDNRPGPTWLQRKTPFSFMTTAWQALRHPRQTGHIIPLYSGDNSHRSLFLWSTLLAGVVVLFLVGLEISYLPVHRFGYNSEYRLRYLFEGFFIGMMIISFFIGIAFSAALLVGLFGLVVYRENLLGPAMRAGCWLSPLLLAIGLIWYGIIRSIVWYVENNLRYSYQVEMMLILTIGAITLIGLWIYLARIHRMTQSMRYANR